MRSQSLAICALLSGVVLSVAVQAQPGSGTRWEMTMEMAGMPPGMGFALPKQRACLSNNVDEAPPAEKDCTVLEQHSTGNHHFIKAQCPKGLMELEQTRTADSMTSLMKMTDNSGEVTEMTMKGVAIGDCDYTAETAQQKRKIAGLQRQADAAEKRSKEQMARMCVDALEKMQGSMFGKDGFCQAQQAEYCKRVNTLEGYQLLTGGAPIDMAVQATYDEQLAVCGTRSADLLRRHCQTAISQANFNFARAYCPVEAPRLCKQAVNEEKLNYVIVICPVEKQALVDQHCAGRKYSSQIAEKYRNFCSGALGSQDGAQDAGVSSGVQQAGASDQAQPATVQEGVKKGVKDGVKSLKKVFGF
ncbi:MAG: hypothetical protein IPH83_21095 [Gammaproteobacteria bacterium]|nr:hypothetical protein [Gammaproteobacteria bacterium]